MLKGDFVALFAQPIARFSDFIFGTHLDGCEGCRRRREFLNKQTIWQMIKMLLHKLFQ